MGQQHDKDVAEDEHRVEYGEKVLDLAGPGAVPGDPGAKAQKEEQQDEGEEFLEGHKGVEPRSGLGFGPAAMMAVIQTEPHEDEEGADAVAQHGQDHVDRIDEQDRLVQVHQLLEGVAQQDEAQDFELLAQGFGHRTGQDEDKIHHLLDQHQGEGEVDGVEMGKRRDPGQKRRQQAPDVEFDAEQAEQEGHDLADGHDAPGFGMFPKTVQGIEKIGGEFVERKHRDRLFGPNAGKPTKREVVFQGARAEKGPPPGQGRGALADGQQRA